MTTEEDFNSLLDDNPDDFQTRLVYADWLEEQGDPRAEGYRAMGVLRKRAFGKAGCGFWNFSMYGDDLNNCRDDGRQHLPGDWFRLLGEAYNSWWPKQNTDLTRREAEDAAALAFAKLPAERRAELLNPTVPA